MNNINNKIIAYLGRTPNFETEVKYYLEWYARRHLGKKIYDCINENGVCSFEAEL